MNKTLSDLYETLMLKATEILAINVISIKAPTANRRGSIRVATREDSILLAAALSSSGIMAEPASHRNYHGVFI